MAEPARAASTYVVEPMEERDAPAVGRLYAMTFSEPIFALLGPRFAARFHQWLQQEPHAGVWVARSAAGEVVGVISGTLDRPRAYRHIVRAHVLEIGLRVLGRLYRPAVMGWLIRAVWQRIRPPTGGYRRAPRPAAELLLIFVAEAAKGRGLAQRLVAHMEAAFRGWGFAGTYKIMTPSTYARANAFYRRLGAVLQAQVPRQQYLLNEYHKTVAADAPRNAI
jgi:GNAT superfamily N-acetyltransferase